MHKKIYLFSAMILLSFLSLQAQITLSFPDQDIKCQESVTFPVVVEDFVNIRSVQFSINWDKNSLEYISSANVGLAPNPRINIDSVPNGKLGLSWFSSEPLTLQNGDTLLTLTLLVENGNLSNVPLSFSGDFIEIEASNSSGLTAVNTENGTITLIDTIAPTITCPPGQIVVNNDGNAAVIIDGLSPTNLTDNCGTIDSVLYVFSGVTSGNGMDDASGIAFDVGTTDITYTAKDTKGNSETCTVQVIVNTVGTTSTLGLGLEAVTAICSDTVIMPISVSDFDSITSLGFSLNWDATTFALAEVSNFAISSMSSADVDITQSPNGNITLAWTDATPRSLANQTALFNLKLVPTTVVNNAVITIANENAAKNNAEIPVTISGQGTATATANNFQLTCPANVLVQIPSGQTQATVANIGAGMVTGNCGNTTLTYTLTDATTGGGANDASGSLFNIGTTKVTYLVENEVGDTTSCSFLVEVTSQAATNFTLIAQSKNAACDDNDISIDINVAAFNNISGTEFSINWDPSILNFTSTDNQLYANGSFGPIDNVNGRINYSWFDGSSDGQTLADGSTLFTMHFTSNGGGMSSIEFSDIPNAIEITQRDNGTPLIIDRDSISLLAGTVTIIDTIPPTIVCPSDIAVNVALGTTDAVITGIDFVSSSDNCGGVDSIYYTINGTTLGNGGGSANGLTFQAGVSTVTYTAVDNAGLTGTCQFQVDINAPNAITVTPTVTSAECGDDLYRVDLLVDSFTNATGLQFTFEWDDTILEYVSRGNLGLPEFDNSDFNETFVQDGSIAFAWADDGSTGENLPAGAILFSLFFKVNGTVGSTTAFTFTDIIAEREASIRLSDGTPIKVPFIGNNAQITVEDTEAPILMTGLPDTLFRFVTDTCGVTRDWEVPTFADQCTNNITLTASPPEGTFYEVGNHTIIYTASDGSGNSTTESTVLIVRDTTAPTLVNCPTDMTITVNSDCQAIATWTEPTAVDNCSDAIIILSSSHIPGAIFTETTTVTYTAEDIAGNQATCSFVVTVEGVAPLIFNDLLGDITVNQSPNGNCGNIISWLEPTVSGGCNSDTDSIVITSTHQPGAFFPVGVTTVVYTATNITTGQTIEQSFNITINRSLDPLTLCPQDIEIQADGTVMNDQLGFINDVRSDTCGRYVVTFNNIEVQNDCGVVRQQIGGPVSGGEFAFGTEMMEFLVIDTINQDTTICTFQIKINETGDLEATTLDNPTCAGSDLRLSVNELIGGTYQWSGPGGFLSNVQAPTIPNAMTQNSGEYIVKVISTNGCTIKDSIMVGVLSGPEIMATSNDLSCAAEDDTIRLFVNITNQIPVQNYIWTGPNGFSTDVQNPMIPNATSSDVGLYIVTGTSSNGCEDIDTVVVNLAGMSTPTLTSDAMMDPICANTPVTLTGTAYDGGIVIYNWIASPDAGLPTNLDTNVITVTPTIPGTYTYDYTASLDGNCFSDTARITLVVSSGTGAITLGSNGPFDCADMNGTINLTAAGENVATYAWTGPNGYTSNDQNPIIPLANEAGGTYTLTATSPEGCTSTDSIMVAVSTQKGEPIITSSTGNLNAGSINVCEGDNLILEGEALTNALYVWTGPNGFAATDSVITIPNVMIDNAGVYQLRVTVNGCTSLPTSILVSTLAEPVANNDSINVTRNESLTFSVTDNDDLTPGADFTISLVSGADNGTLVNNNDGTFTYTPNNNFVGMDQIAYEVCYTDCPNLCDMGIMTIRTGFDVNDPCMAPTFISPNNDGFNDAFIISCIPSVPKVGSELLVFNEWGSEVFRESPYQNNWQGTYNGQDLPDGTYYYIFKEDNDDTNPIKGYVTIFR